MHFHEAVSKKVKFSEDVLSEKEVIPLKKMRRASMRNLFYKRFADGEYEQLKKDLEQYKKDGYSLDKFFDKEGDILLNLAIVGISEAKPFQFLLENMSISLIKQKLLANGCYVLNQFLLGESSFEKNKILSEKQRKDRVEKIKSLLEIDCEVIYSFFNERLKNPYNLETMVLRDVEQAMQKKQALVLE